jgi:uncharacterized protein YbjT (DUF2867 family)
VKVVVIGGTGLLGSKIASELAGGGHDALRASPGTGVDTITGEGLADALEGAAVVVDASNSPSLEAGPAMEFFTTSTGNLLAAEAAAGVGHHLVLSIVGVERVTGSGYYRAKVAQEGLIRDAAIPYTIVHATQFFEFVEGIAGAATDGDTVRLPHVLVQPIAADELAAVISELAQGPPANGTTEVAGPEQFHLDDLVRQALMGRDDPRAVVADPDARYFGAELDERTLLPATGAHLGATRFRAWLAERAAGAAQDAGR